jgi:hypothetical protein
MFNLFSIKKFEEVGSRVEAVRESLFVDIPTPEGVLNDTWSRVQGVRPDFAEPEILKIEGYESNDTISI